jgi:hypothetical protein
MKKHEILEKELQKKRVIHRCVLAGLALVFLAMLIVSSWLIEATAEIVEYDWGFGYTHEDKVYNEAYIPFIVAGICGSVTCAAYLITSFIISRFQTVEVNGYYVTVNRGIIARQVYVDGELADSLLMKYNYFTEIVIPDGTRVSVAFGRTIFDGCYISFSNGHSTVEF